MIWLYIDYQLDAPIIIYSSNNILLYIFWASSAHLQEDTVVHVQHMVLSLSVRVPGVLRHPPTTFPLQSVLTQAVYRQATRNSHREWQYHMLHVYNCILLKMSIWGSKHVEENIILWINNKWCIKLVINIQSWCNNPDDLDLQMVYYLWYNCCYIINNMDIYKLKLTWSGLDAARLSLHVWQPW